MSEQPGADGVRLLVQQMAGNNMPPEQIEHEVRRLAPWLPDPRQVVAEILGTNGHGPSQAVVPAQPQPWAPAPPSQQLVADYSRFWVPGMRLPAEHETLRQALDNHYGKDRARLTRERRMTRDADRDLDAAEEADARGGRRTMTWRELTAQPKPVWVLPDRLTIGWHGLAGPPEAGKSLLARSWLCEAAASGRHVVYAYSEGEFDMQERFEADPLIAQAWERLLFYGDGLNLGSPSDVAWFCGEYRERRPALIVFDVIYDFGLPDDNGTKGVAPVITGAKKISTELGAAVVAVGHPPLSAERRFRGSSMWRASFVSEWHMGDNLVSCEKHKHANKLHRRWPYLVDFPQLRMQGNADVMDQAARRMAIVDADFRSYPDDNVSARARRLAGPLGVSSPDYARRLIRGFRTGSDADQD